MTVVSNPIWPFLESPLIEQRGFVVFLRHFSRRGLNLHSCLKRHWIDWAQRGGSLKNFQSPFESLISIVLELSEAGTPGPCGIGIECDGSLKQHSRGPMVADKGMHCSKNGQNDGIVATNLCCPFG